MVVIEGQTFHVRPRVDALNPGSNSVVSGCTVTTTPNPASIPHWDWWQGISRIPGRDNRQYAAALLENFIVSNNTVDGRDTTLQCVFAIDGRINNAIVSDNTLDTGGVHRITLGGVKSGTFVNNRDFDGNPVPAVLESLRIGGTVYILSFKDADDEYQACIGYVEDYRRTPNRKANGIDLVNFDLKGFLEYERTAIPAKGDGETIAKLSAQAALKFGDVFTGDTIMPEQLVTKTLRLSDKGIEALVSDEGNMLQVYKDEAGYDSIGVGRKLLEHELAEGRIEIGREMVDFVSDGLTPQQAEQLFREDVAPREEELSRLLAGIDVNQDQYDALFSLMYNIGGAAFAGSTVLKRLKAGDFNGVPEAFTWWNKITVNGVKQPSKGLTARRKREADKFAGSAASSIFQRATQQTVTSGLGSQVFTGAAQIVAENVVAAEQPVHDSTFDSTTIQGIAGMVVSWAFMFLVSKGWFPESMSQLVQPVVVEGLLGVLGLFFTNKAVQGRLTAVKGFK